MRDFSARIFMGTEISLAEFLCVRSNAAPTLAEVRGELARIFLGSYHIIHVFEE